MSFRPYTVYATRLSVLKPGYVFRIGDKFYMIKTVRRNRKRFYITDPQTKYRLYLTTDPSYESLHGSLERNRVVHLQYLGVDQSGVTTRLWWGTEPLLSKDVDEPITTDTAPLDAPIEIDRWSYDPAMHLFLSQSDSQAYVIEVIEYEITPYEATPARPYLHLMGNGQAIFVENTETENTLSRIERAM